MYRTARIFSYAPDDVGSAAWALRNVDRCPDRIVVARNPAAIFVFAEVFVGEHVS
jgi:hypothetical protein